MSMDLDLSIWIRIWQTLELYYSVVTNFLCTLLIYYYKVADQF